MYAPTRPPNSPYAGLYTDYIAMPMGGIGAGMISIDGSGALRSPQWRHRPELEKDCEIFAALSIVGDGGAARLLQGPVANWQPFGQRQGGGGHVFCANGLPRCGAATFTNRFPFAQVELSEPALPLRAAVSAWSPFVPADADASSLPVAGLEYRFENPGDSAVEAVFSWHAMNPVVRRGQRQVSPDDQGPRPPGIRRIEQGLVFSQPARPEAPHEEAHCAMMLLDEPETSVDAAWFRGAWFDARSMLWKAIRDGQVLDRPPPNDSYGPSPGGSLYLPITLAPGESRTVRVLIAWYTPQSDLNVSGPQEHTLNPDGCCPGGDCGSSRYHRPWYAAHWSSIDELAAFWRREYGELQRRTRLFVDSFYSSELPPEVIEAVSCNLAILKSPTVLRDDHGRLWGWEGCSVDVGCCAGSCTHVWNYAQAVAHLFPELERSLRETEFGPSQGQSGHQSFRSTLPIGEKAPDNLPACDGQLGGIVKVYRDWRISGDTDWLRRLWPAVQRSLDFCIETYDPTRCGHITEPHHNTYDIEFWGPNGMAMSFYLAALQAGAIMAEAMGADPAPYRQLLAMGGAYSESELFDGEYYIQKIDWSETAQSPLEFQEQQALVKQQMPPEAQALLEAEGPKYQYGTGCLSDGVLGEFLAWASGLPPVLDAARLRSHLAAVHRHNLTRDLSAHANPQRPSYAIGAEGGLLLCSWPKGGELSLPFVYSNEVWTGIEYQVAAHAIALGEVDAGLEIVRLCRARYDGSRRNPYDEYECGHFYARAMASYALLQALSGLRYDAVERTLYLAPRLDGDFRCFIATATGFGQAGVRDGEPFCEAAEGEIPVDHIVWEGRP